MMASLGPKEKHRQLAALRSFLSSEDDYRDLFENASDIIYTHDLSGVFTSINKAAERITGHTREEALGTSVIKWLDAESQVAAMEMIQQKLGGAPHTTYEVTLIAKDGRPVALEVGTRLVFRDGVPVGIQGIARDITERKRAESLELDRNRVLELVAGNEPLAAVLAEICRLVERQLSGVLCSVALAPGVDPVLGATPSLPSGHPDNLESPDAATCHKFQLVARDGHALGAFLLRCPAGKEAGPGELKALETAQRLAVVAIEHRQLTDQLAYQALHDALTGLPNRALLEQRLDQTLAGALRHNWQLAVLFIDLDRFKQINDTLGHALGDRVLQRVARRLEGCLRKSDVLARMGGDEFTVLLAEVADSRDALRVAEKLLASFEEPFQIEGHDLFLTCSVGISLFPRDGKDAVTLQRKADTAMYRAKNRGKNSCEFFAPEFGVAALERLEIENSLRRALDNRELHLYYQPQVDAGGKLAGFEALLAWHHPKLGLTSPAQFIPVAEESGMIVPIGSWVLAEACRQGAVWQHSGCPRVRVAVNVSATQFSRVDFIDTVTEALSVSGLEPSLLELELTEGVVVRDLEESIRQMERVRALGVGISIDDFGTGYSSLSYLRRLPIDALKIDQSFLREIDREPNTIPLVKAIVALAHGLHLAVVAEGVENQGQLEALRNVGCDLFQGYLLGEPAPATVAERLILEGIARL
jgi:diguanylate cyclase (GGDEF)-like protein/PAS domain S-box-containing protein